MKARGAHRLGRLREGDPRAIAGFRLVGRIGAGGMGTVYAGTAEGVRGYLAVKVLSPEHAADPRFRHRFAREARLLARVNSPCVTRFVQADVEADPPWLVTEYVPGPTLRHHVERHGPLRGGMLLALAAGTAEALRAVHAAGVVHRDLKPGNVVLAPSGPKVLDFGIANPADSEDPTRWLRVRRLRRRLRALRLPAHAPPAPPVAASAPAGDRAGTPGWISPEQYRGEAVTDRSDVFLWGGVVAFAAAAHDPFGHAHPREMARRVLHEAPDLDRLPSGLERLVVAAMAKQPANRPDAAGLLDAVLALDPDSHAGRTPTLRRLLDHHWTEVAVRVPKPPREMGRIWPRG